MRTLNLQDKIRYALTFGRKLIGTRYGPGWKKGTWPAGPPLYSRFDPKVHTIPYMKSHDMICTGLTNVLLGSLSLSAPGRKGGDPYPGGTAAYWRVYRSVSEPFNPNKKYPLGTLLGSPYLGPALEQQGHVAVVSTDAPTRQQKLLQSDRLGGVNEGRTVGQSHALFNFTYAVLPRRWLGGGNPSNREGDSSEVVTFPELRAIMEGASDERLRAFLPHLNHEMRAVGITTLHRKSHFLSQVGHETGGMRWLQELDSADGSYLRSKPYYPYYGRGLIHLTWADNYREYGRRLGVDLVNNPERAKDPDVASKVAALYWLDHGINEKADLKDASIRAVTYAINGGYNGLEDRTRRYYQAKEVLSGRTEADEGEMVFRKIILSHATHRDGALACIAAAVLHDHNKTSTVADAQNIGPANALCWSEPVGSREFVVIGEAAKRRLPDEVHRWIGMVPSRSDYRDAIGKNLEDTAKKLGHWLDTQAKGAGEEFVKYVEMKQSGT